MSNCMASAKRLTLVALLLFFRNIILDYLCSLNYISLKSILQLVMNSVIYLTISGTENFSFTSMPCGFILAAWFNTHLALTNLSHASYVPYFMELYFQYLRFLGELVLITWWRLNCKYMLMNKQLAIDDSKDVLRF